MFKSRRKQCEPSLPKETILLVDSNPEDVEVIQQVCASEGIKVEVNNSLDDVDHANMDLYSLVIIDLNIDKGTGISLVSKIKQQSGTSGIGVITTSDCMTPDDILNSLSAGADDYLLKPIVPREFIARVRSLIRRSRITS